MLSSGVVDVALALVYVFVVVSILVSAINELIAGLFKQRAKALWHGLKELLTSSVLRDEVFRHPLIRSLAPPTSLLRLSPPRVQGPSYIPKQAFALALIDILHRPHPKLVELEALLDQIASGLRAAGRPPIGASDALNALVAGLPASPVVQSPRSELAALAGAITRGVPANMLLPMAETLQRLLSMPATRLETNASFHSPDLGTIVRLLVADARGDTERLRTAIEAWFDAGMDRVAGWYKRWTQVWQFAIGLVLAIALNVNMVTIGETLWTSIPLRNAIVAQAGEAATVRLPGAQATDDGEKAEAAEKRIESTQRLLEKTGLPIGWACAPADWLSQCFHPALLPGFLLTAIGASFGAPFWFDLLSRFVQLRSGGPSPAAKEKDDEARKRADR